MITEFKIITRQVSNQNKAKFPNINPPFFQKNIQNELNYKGLSLSKTLTKHSFSRKISTGRVISEIVTELNATRRSHRNISCFGLMKTKPHISAHSRFTLLKRRLPQPQNFPILNYMSDRPLTSVRRSSLTAETSRSLVRNLFGQSFMTRQGEWYGDMQKSKSHLSRTVC